MCRVWAVIFVSNKSGWSYLVFHLCDSVLHQAMQKLLYINDSHLYRIIQMVIYETDMWWTPDTHSTVLCIINCKYNVWGVTKDILLKGIFMIIHQTSDTIGIALSISTYLITSANYVTVPFSPNDICTATYLIAVAQIPHISKRFVKHQLTH